ncbi:hypothetical protein N7497_004898 [Penicillium chrysogenum]|uniref:GED domain-containing protein n=1 Tax=Penicillium chrysogenum TaxID=5076 RepID=A0ABQ8WNJ5_PENCH|nr:hypothetical protein N7505_002847 [Penicillium chrysogenum]KAJ6156013.1 hypothetical protein N7497_004898 [Penicillium chrysogenum]
MLATILDFRYAKVSRPPAFNAAFATIFDCKTNKNEVAEHAIPTLREDQLELLSQHRGLREARARVRAKLLREANYIMDIVLMIIENSYYDNFPPYNLLWVLETRMQVLIEQVMALQSDDEEESRIACDIWDAC